MLPVRSLVFAALFATCVTTPVWTKDLPCRLALALGLDVSGSVDAREYRLQLDGLASALDAPAVRSALFAEPNSVVKLMVYEWSGALDQHVLIPWSEMSGPNDIAKFQEILRSSERRRATPGTALGQAMQTGFTQLSTQTHCEKHTLDISGDGKSNNGPEPRFLRDLFTNAGMTVNALVIGADAPGFGDLRQEEIAELSSYFRVNVIAGPDAFVQTALGYEQYAEAMTRKLERELQVFIFSQDNPTTQSMELNFAKQGQPPRPTRSVSQFRHPQDPSDQG